MTTVTDNGQTGDTCGIHLNYVSGTNLKFGSVSGGCAPQLVIVEVA